MASRIPPQTLWKQQQLQTSSLSYYSQSGEGKKNPSWYRDSPGTVNMSLDIREIFHTYGSVTQTWGRSWRFLRDESFSVIVTFFQKDEKVRRKFQSCNHMSLRRLNPAVVRPSFCDDPFWSHQESDEGVWRSSTRNGLIWIDIGLSVIFRPRRRTRKGSSVCWDWLQELQYHLSIAEIVGDWSDGLMVTVKRWT